MHWALILGLIIYVARVSDHIRLQQFQSFYLNKVQNVL